MTLQKLLLVFFAGGAGCVTRFVVGGWVGNLVGTAFPWGTFTVNVIGSTALAAIMQIVALDKSVDPVVQLALTTGFLGGFTTYSSFNYDTLECFTQGDVTLGMVNLVATVSTCLVGAVVGTLIVRWTYGT